MMQSECGGLAMGIAVHTDMATPPILAFGTASVATPPPTS